VFAAILICSVIGISDGDIASARCAIEGAHLNIMVRLAGIDVPEKAQSYGTRSKQNLSALCFHKSAEVRPVSMDRYGRTVAHVNYDGHDAGAEQIRAGLAWVFVRYAAKGSPLYGLEREARAHRRGICGDAQRVSPWDWRRSVHRGHSTDGMTSELERPILTPQLLLSLGPVEATWRGLFVA
jgi:endonuclease YncB( thermonuclease family)